MDTTQAFKKLLQNIVVDNDEQFSNRYKEITKKLNKTFRNTDSETDNSLQVGSYGRYTGIKGISDLDMMYIMPDSKWNEYKNNPNKLLRDTRDALQKRYPNTDITYDILVVVVNFKNFKFEVQPVFRDLEEDDDLPVYWFPNTREDRYKKTKPKHEQSEMTRFRQENGDTHRRLCKIMRAWKNNSGLAMGGLLMDTLVYNYLNEHEEHKSAGLSQFDEVCRDFFAYLKGQPQKDYYLAIGSHQRVYVKHRFKTKAKNAYNLAVNAIAEDNLKKCHDIWREIFGNSFPRAEIQVAESRMFSANGHEVVDNEQFIEDLYSINITEYLNIDCEITVKGYRPCMLSELLQSNRQISISRSLKFFIKNTSAKPPYTVKWKVKNVGEAAIQRNCLRGEIVPSNKDGECRIESSDFKGPHYVECYIIKDNIVIARDRINVPIV